MNTFPEVWTISCTNKSEYSQSTAHIVLKYVGDCKDTTDLVSQSANVRSLLLQLIEATQIGPSVLCTSVLAKHVYKLFDIKIEYMEIGGSPLGAKYIDLCRGKSMEALRTTWPFEASTLWPVQENRCIQQRRASAKLYRSQMPSNVHEAVKECCSCFQDRGRGKPTETAEFHGMWNIVGFLPPTYKDVYSKQPTASTMVSSYLRGTISIHLIFPNDTAQKCTFPQ